MGGFLEKVVEDSAKYVDNFDLLITMWAKFLKDNTPIARVKQEIKRVNPALSDAVINPSLKYTIL